MEEETRDKKRHSRNISYHKAMPRRSTKGPLDVDEDPLGLGSQGTDVKPLPDTPERARSNRSSMIDQPQERPSDLPPRKPTIKDFSFLLHPEIYHHLPTPFLLPPQPIPTECSFFALLETGNYHGAALRSAERLTGVNAASLSSAEVFELVYARYVSLIHLGHVDIASEESKALGDVHSKFYRDDMSGDCLLPWKLRVLAVRLQAAAFADYGRRGIGGCYDLSREARQEIVQAVASSNQKAGNLWKTRLQHLSLLVADVLLDQGDLTGAVRHLSSLRHQRDTSPSPAKDAQNENPPACEDIDIDMRMALIYMKLGDIDAAKRVLSAYPPRSSSITSSPASTRLNLVQALTLFCAGNIQQAEAALLDLHNATFSASGLAGVISNDLAVSRFYAANLPRAIDTFSSIITPDANDSNHESKAAKGEQFPKEALFNLSTCYELASERGARQNKEKLVEAVRRAVRAQAKPSGLAAGGKSMALTPADFKLM